jgi:hypothetical protein
LTITNFREKRSNSKPDEEGNKETPPGEMESTHVGALKGAELDFSGLVILVRVYIQLIGLVLLPLSLNTYKEREQ